MQNGTGLKFFSELYTYDFDNDILAAFSFTNQFVPNVNNYIYPDTWALSSATGILVGNNTFFNFSGTGFFNGNTLVKLNKPVSLTRTTGSEVNYNSTLLFSYEKQRHGDEILISSLGKNSNFPYEQSGFCVGINDANKLYFKYWNEVEGSFSFIYNKVIANKNLVAIQNDKKNSISIGVFNNNTLDFEFENFEIYRQVFNDSKNICLGGIDGNKPEWVGSNVQNFSGYFDNFYFLRDIDSLQLDNLVSGLIYEPPNDIPGFLSQECFIEEVISGSGFLSFEETGITFGITTGYITGVTGLETGVSGILSTGITGYLKFLTGTSIDNCGDITELYAYEALTGTTVNNIEYEIELTGLIEITGWSEIRLSGFVERFTDVTLYNQICTDRLILTGDINYNIQTGFLTSLSYDYIALLSQINPSNDKIEIFIENFQPTTLKYNVNLQYDQVRQNYYLLDKEYNENEFLLWANGQALTNSGFDSVKDGYDEFKIPKVDYFVNEREIETTDIYKEFDHFLFYDNISGNYWVSKQSGQGINIPTNLSNNYWVFRNGQKLIKGINADYIETPLLLKQSFPDGPGSNFNNTNFNINPAINGDASIIFLGAHLDNENGGYAGKIEIWTGNKNIGWSFKQKILGNINNYLGRDLICSKNGNILISDQFINKNLSIIYTGNLNSNYILVPNTPVRNVVGTTKVLSDNGNVFCKSYNETNVLIGQQYSGITDIYTINNGVLSHRQSITGRNSNARLRVSAINEDGSLIVLHEYLNTGLYLYTGNSINGWELKQSIVNISGGFELNGLNSQGNVMAVHRYTGNENLQENNFVDIYTGNIENNWVKVSSLSAVDPSLLFNDDGSILYIIDRSTFGSDIFNLYTHNNYIYNLKQSEQINLRIDNLSTNADGSVIGVGLLTSPSITGKTDIFTIEPFKLKINESTTQNQENYYIIKEIPDNFIYHSGNSGSLKLTGAFNHGCSQVYFNGIKQKINNNYFENSDFDLISGSFFNNASSDFIYNNTDDWFE